jgi:hypothetical protein
MRVRIAVCNGPQFGLRRSHFAGDAKAMRGWVKVLANLGPVPMRKYLAAHPATGKGMEGALNQSGATAWFSILCRSRQPQGSWLSRR